MPSPQQPINSGFGARTKAVEALGERDLSGKTAIVTGGYSDLGLEVTRVLAQAGASVIVPARTPDKAQAALEGQAGVELAALELMDPASIDACASAFVDSDRPLHMPVNCAGVMAAPLTRDARGYESQFWANHLGHFQLTARLWPALQRAGGARVVAVSSSGHRRAGVDFEDPNFERRPYHKWKAYGQSKTANALFAVELDRRGQAHGVRAFSLHPGMILTDLSRHLSDPDFVAMGFRDEHGNVPAEKLDLYKSVPRGAATIVWCAASTQLEGLGGVYCEHVDVAEAVAAESTQSAGVRPWAIDPELARRLWRLSEELCGLAGPA